MKKPMWEVLVPASKGKQRFSYEHHKAWDEKVRKIAGGLTVMRGAKGEWVSPDGKLYVDRMIPVRISCSRKEIKQIAQLVIDHYRQEAALVYKVSDDVIIVHKTQPWPENK